MRKDSLGEGLVCIVSIFLIAGLLIYAYERYIGDGEFMSSVPVDNSNIVRTIQINVCIFKCFIIESKDSRGISTYSFDVFLWNY